MFKNVVDLEETPFKQNAFFTTATMTEREMITSLLWTMTIQKIEKMKICTLSTQF
jgi:hypothetical protein